MCVVSGRVISLAAERPPHAPVTTGALLVTHNARHNATLLALRGAMPGPCERPRLHKILPRPRPRPRPPRRRCKSWQVWSRRLWGENSHLPIPTGDASRIERPAAFGTALRRGFHFADAIKADAADPCATCVMPPPLTFLLLACIRQERAVTYEAVVPEATLRTHDTSLSSNECKSAQ